MTHHFAATFFRIFIVPRESFRETRNGSLRGIRVGKKPVNQIRDKERKKRNACVHDGEKKDTRREGKGGMRKRRGGKNIIGNRSGVRIPNESAFNNLKFAGHAHSAFFLDTP